MAKEIRTAEEPNEKKNLPVTNLSTDTTNGQPERVSHSRQSSNKRIIRTTREEFDAPITEPPVNSIPYQGRTDEDDDDLEEVDEEAQDFQDFFSNVGDGSKSLWVYRCPGTAWSPIRQAIFVAAYPYDRVSWAPNLQRDNPEGGKFWLALRHSEGPLSGKMAAPWRQQEIAPLPMSQRQQAPFQPQHGAFQQPAATPADAIRESMAPVREVLGVLKEMGLMPQQATAPTQSPFEKFCIESTMRRMERLDEEPPRPPGELPRSMGDALVELGATALEKNPNLISETVSLVKTGLQLLFTQGQQQVQNPAERQQPHADAEAEVVHTEPDAIDAAPETQQTAQPKRPFQEAYSEVILFVIDSMVNEKPVDNPAEALRLLATDYPEETAGIGQIILETPPADLKVMLKTGTPVELQRKIEQCSSAELWIAQLQKKLKERK